VGGSRQYVVSTHRVGVCKWSANIRPHSEWVARKGGGLLGLLVLHSCQKMLRLDVCGYVKHP
jgi:hypothetical protein